MERRTVRCLFYRASWSDRNISARFALFLRLPEIWAGEDIYGCHVLGSIYLPHICGTDCPSTGVWQLLELPVQMDSGCDPAFVALDLFWVCWLWLLMFFP
jgi:hypothetical protein